MEHPKIAQLSDGAFRLWVQGLAYCQKFLTDGVIVTTALRQLKAYSPKRLAMLTAPITPGGNPLWHTIEAGVLVNDYLHWNESREKVLGHRQAAKDRLAKYRTKHADQQEVKRVSDTRICNADETELTHVTHVTHVHPQKIKSVSSEALAPTELPVLVFPTVGVQGHEWRLTRTQISAWAELYPSVDVEAETRKALAWVHAHPDRRKTAKGMPKFLVGWLSRANDSRRMTGGPSLLSKQTQQIAAATAEFLRHDDGDQ